MSWWPLTALVVSLALLVLVIAIGRYSDRRGWPAWEAALDADDRQAQDAFWREVDARLASVDAALRLARCRHSSGERDAPSMLRRALLAAARLARRLDDWLHRWRDTARALAALRPSTMPSMFAFRAWNVRALVVAHVALDFVLVTSRQRFRNRLAFLRHALRRLRRACTEVAGHAYPRAWDFERLAVRAEHTRDDLRVVAACCGSELDALAVSRRSQRDSASGRP